MKKIIMFFVLLLTLTSCCYECVGLDDPNPNIEYKYDVKILSPTGAPALSTIGLYNDGLDVTYVNGSDLLSSAFINNEYDMIIAPTNLGANLILNKDVNYTLASIITTGNLYLVSDKSIENIDEVESIAIFGKSTVVDKVFNTALSDSLEGISLDYYSSTSETYSMLLADKYDVALVSEPLVTSLVNSGNYKILYDIQEEYEKVTTFEFYPQASIFVNKTSIEKVKTAYLDTINNIENFVNDMHSDINTLEDELIELSDKEYKVSDIGLVDNSTAIDSFERMNVHFYDPKDYESELSEFLELFNIEYSSELIE